MRLCKAVDNEFLFIKPLATLAAQFPVEAVQCLSLLLGKLRPDRAFVLDRDEVRAILKAGFASLNPAAVALAREAKDALLARGNFSFQDIGE